MADTIFDEPVRGVTELDLSLLRLRGVDALRTMLDHDTAAPPFARMTGVRMTAVEEGGVTFELPASDWLRGPKGRILPGVLVFFADAPLSYGVASALPPGGLFSTAELSLTFLGDHPHVGGTLTAEGTALYNDGANVLSTAALRDTDGHVVAHGTSRSFVFPPVELDALPTESPERAPEPEHDTPDPWQRSSVGDPLPAEVFDAMSGLEILRGQVEGSLPASPVNHFLGMRPTAADEGTATFVMPASPWLRNIFGQMYGGATAMLAHSACAAAVQTMAPAGTTFTALDVKVNFLRPVEVDGGELSATGTIAHLGRTLAVANSKVVNAQGKTVALASGTTMLRAGSQDTRSAAETSDQGRHT